MLPSFGLDRRTKGYRLVSQVAAAAIGSAAQYAFNRFSSGMPKYRAAAPRWRAGRRHRSRRNFRRRYRRRTGAKRTVRKVLIAGRGPYQKRFSRIQRRALNTNLTRNDYDSTREIIEKGTVVPLSTHVHISYLNFQIGDMSLALSKLFDYDDYKVSGIQLVITPCTFPDGQLPVDVDAASEPYFYVVPRIHPETWTSTPALATLKTTPGVLRFHYLRRKPIVINLAAQGIRQTDVITSSTGTANQVELPMKMLGWQHNPQTVGPIVATNYSNFGNVAIVMPRLATGSFQPRYKIEYYATAMLRGNRALLDV